MAARSEVNGSFRPHVTIVEARSTCIVFVPSQHAAESGERSALIPPGLRTRGGASRRPAYFRVLGATLPGGGAHGLVCTSAVHLQSHIPDMDPGARPATFALRSSSPARPNPLREPVTHVVAAGRVDGGRMLVSVPSIDDRAMPRYPEQKHRAPW